MNLTLFFIVDLPDEKNKKSYYLPVLHIILSARFKQSRAGYLAN
jgi:hypothetical protein